MKAIMYVWVEKPDNLPSWFEHNKSIDITQDQIMELFKGGANVMMLHGTEPDDEILLAVDTRMFGQR